MTIDAFIAKGEELSRQAGVLDSLHAYFRAHAPRLHQSCQIFDLFGKLGDVLEVGPFFGYIPFILRPGSTSYTIMEGDDPVVYPLKPLYQQHDIRYSLVDFFETFGPTQTATHVLPFPDASFHTILCWETMEHFNFNPVKFVRELHRLLKPGGRVCITVPNRASFQSIAGLLLGRGERTTMEGYFRYEDYISNGKKAFYGFHWREYTRTELIYLFRESGYKITQGSTFTAFQDCGHVNALRKVARLCSQVGTTVLPRFGTNAYLVAEK